MKSYHAPDTVIWFNRKRSVWKRGLCFVVCLAYLLNIVLLPTSASADSGSNFLLTMAVDKNTVYPGEPFVYTIQYSNPDIIHDAVSATITDVLPANIEYISAEGSSHIDSIEKTGIPGSETVIFHFKDPLPAGSSGVLHITARFPTGITLGGASHAAVNSATIVSDNKPAFTSETVTVTPQTKAPDWSVSKTKTVPSSTPTIGYPVTYRITVNGNSVIGGLNMTDLVITDPVPAGAAYISSSDGGVFDPDTGMVTFPAISTLSVGQSVSRTVTLLYSDPDFNVGSSIINGASAEATLLGESTPIMIQTTATHGFSSPIFAIGDFTKSARQSNDRYSTGQEAVFYLNGISNIGNVPFDQIVIEDDIPAIITLNSISAGSYNQAVHVAIYYQTDLEADYVLWSGIENPSNQELSVADLRSSLKIGTDEKVTKVRWVISSTEGLQPGFSIGSSMVLRATVNAPAGNDINNTAHMTATKGIETLTDESSKMIYVIDALPWLVPGKTVRKSGVGSFASAATVNMQDIVEFRLRIQNHPYATGVYVDPIAVDVLPAELENVTFDRYVKSSGTVAITLNEPLAEIVDNRWVFQFVGTLLPGEFVDVFYTARVKNQTTVGLYNNDLFISTLENDTSYQNDAGQQIADSGDLDGDEILTDRFIKSVASFFVKYNGSLNSTKLMRGALDADWTKYPSSGSTLPGGISDYQIAITNDGSNGPIGNIVIIDELPDIGDTSVLGSTPRLSAWQPYLVNSITYHYYDAHGAEKAFPSGAVVTTYYSASRSLTTAELYNPLGGSPDVSWTTVLPDDITSVQALKFKFTNFELGKDEGIQIKWPMRAPIDAPVGLVAWNSFAYGATYTDYVNDVVTATPFLPSEPIKVGFMVQDPSTHPYSIGDFVWEDMNKNGIQDPGEPGINGILVNLYDSGDNLVSYTRSGDNQAGEAGYFRFPDVPAGQYYLQFVYAADYEVTNYQAGGNPALDSTIDQNLEVPFTDFSIVKNSIKTSPFSLVADDLSIDAGLYRYAELGDFVWNDRDADGIRDDGEPGVAGVRVDLLDGAGSPMLHSDASPIHVLTDANGFYRFSNLDPGDYKLTFTNPGARYAFSPVNIGADDAADSDGTAAGDGSSATTGVISLTSGQTDLSVDQGIYLGRIGDFVFHDFNANGVRDVGDSGIGGVTVKLYDGTGTTLLMTTTTDSSGYYLFDDLLPSDYLVQVVLPGTYARITLQDQLSDEANDSDVDRTTGKTDVITISAGERDMTIDAGLYKYASLGNLVWNDRDKDGNKDSGEPGILGVAVHLLDGFGAPVLDSLGDPIIKTTDANGAYLFSNLEPGDYKVKFINPGGNYGISPANATGDTTDSDGISVDGGVSATTGTYTLRSADNNMTVDQGFYLGRIGDLVFHDLNANGIQDAGESGISGITVKLYAADGATLLKSATTNGTGNYLFEDVFAGSYMVEISIPGTYNRITMQDQGANDNVDSDVDRTTGRTGLIVMDIGERDLTQDAGLYKYASIGDKVWFDQDADGVQDAGEAALPNITVHLLNSDGSQAINDNGVLVSPVQTDANGLYSFGTLTPGSYRLQFDLPTAEYLRSPVNTATALIDSDANVVTGLTIPTTLTSGENDVSWDAGFYKALIGDLVFEDKNANGIQDGGEPGIANVTVQLWLSDGLGGWTYNAQTATDANGLYAFTRLDSGIYQVRFTSPGAGWHRSPANLGANDTIDSDQDASGYSGVIDMTTGETDKTIDAGFYRLASVGDRLWNDLDGNGAQDAGEAGWAGVVVHLTGPYDTDLQTTTDANGYYSFAGMIPGSYTVTVNTAGLPVGFFQSHEQDDSKNGSTAVVLASNDNRTDIDFGYYVMPSIGDRVFVDTNANGIQDGGETGLAGVTVHLLNTANSVLRTTVTDDFGNYLFADLTVGSYKIRVIAPSDYLISPIHGGSDDSADSDLQADGRTAAYALSGGAEERTVDGGLYLPASIGDTVWLDSNGNGVQDETDQGFYHVEVRLFDGIGSLLDTAYTDIDGKYLFDNLTPGTYRIQFIVPDGYGFTVKDAFAATDASDSDADGLSGLAPQATLASGENNRNFDAGLARSAINITKQLYGGTYDPVKTPLDSLSAMQGTPVTYIFTVHNTGSTYLKDIDISDPSLGITKADMTLIGGVEPLAPGDSIRYYYQAQVAGDLVNVASVMADPSDPEGNDLLGLTSPEDQDSATRYALSMIGDYVWEDNSMDGLQDSGEQGYAGVKVILRDGEGFIRETITDANGYYSFSDLVPGTYTVTIDSTTLPTGFWPTFEMDSTMNGQVTVTLEDGDLRTDVDFGYYAPGSLGDTVWLDSNRDGLQQAGEPGIADVRVILLDRDRNPFMETLTDATGNYLFADLKPGTYSIMFIKPAKMKFTAEGSGMNAAIDSDVAQDGKTMQKNLNSGENDTTIDGGLYFVVDLPGISVDEDGLPLSEAIIILIGQDGEEIGRTVSDENGGFEFKDIPGEQTVTIIVKKTGLIDKTVSIQIGTEDIPNTSILLDKIVIPETGEKSDGNWPLAMVLILGAAAACLIRRRRLVEY